VVAIRRLGPDDWQAWRALRLAALAEAPGAFGSTLADWADAGEDRWRARLGIPGSHNVLAVLDGRPVGLASGVPTDDPALVELISMWVSPLGRGRGVGRTLVDEVAGWARRVGADLLRLDVVEGNAAALSFYERTGFRYTGEVFDEDGRRELRMSRLLPSESG
jgi:ribosomal protein S18 acetylase RimI-like enzyme